jgi:hypothetical protein
VRLEDVTYCPAGNYSIPVAKIDGDAWWFVTYLLSHPNMIGDAVERLRDVREEEDIRAEERLASYEGLRKKLDEDELNLRNGIRESSSERVRATLLADLDAVLRRREELDAEEAQLTAKAVDRFANAQQLLDLEKLATRAAALHDQMSYKQKRAMLYALGLRVYIFAKDHSPRYRIKCDFEGLQTGMDVSMFDIDDQQLAALRAGRMHSDTNKL